jgi:hypothetical protein
MILLKLEPEKVMQDEEARHEFLSWAMSDRHFLESFVELLANGVSPEGSWPSQLDAIRAAFHRAIGEDYLAELTQQVQELKLQRTESLVAIERLENMLLKLGAMRKAPCFICGYNGPGYFQPDHHACAERHHQHCRFDNGDVV